MGPNPVIVVIIPFEYTVAFANCVGILSVVIALGVTWKVRFCQHVGMGVKLAHPVESS